MENYWYLETLPRGRDIVLTSKHITICPPCFVHAVNPSTMCARCAVTSDGIGGFSATIVTSRRAPHMGVLLRLWKCFVCRTICTRVYFMFHVVACERFDNTFANGEIWVWTCRSTPWFENRRSCKSICKSFLRFFICKWTICKNKLNFFVQICQYFFSDRRNDLTFANRPTNSQPYYNILLIKLFSTKKMVRLNEGKLSRSRPSEL